MRRVSKVHENIESCLDNGQFSDLKIVCGDNTFRVHQLVITANCAYFHDILSKSSIKKKDRIELEEAPELVARLIYFLYYGKYPTTHVADLRIESFEDVFDHFAPADRLSLLHAKMYCIGNDFGVPELSYAASQAFRSLDQKVFCANPEWPDLVDYIYSSTPPKLRDLRDIVVREVLYATNQDRARIKMQDLNDAIKTTPKLAADLATTALSKQTFECSNCCHCHYLLVLPCSYKEQHEADNSGCFKLGLEEQESCACHQYGVFGREVDDETVVDERKDDEGNHNAGV